MSPIIGNPESLRFLAQSWSSAATVDAAAMDSLQLASTAITVAVTGADSAGVLGQAVAAPAGSLDGAERLLDSASRVLSNYATELEVQQSLWLAAQTTLDQSEAAATEVTRDADPRSRTPGDFAPQFDQLEALTTGARADQAAAVTAAETAATDAVAVLETVVGELELLAERAVVGGGAVPLPAMAAPLVGEVPAGARPSALVTAAELPHAYGPTERAQWFDGLTPAQQYAVITTYPDFVGQADGFPASARDQANQILLDRDLDRQDAALTALGLDRSAVDTEEGREEVRARLWDIGWSEADISTALTTWAVAAEVRRAQDRDPERPVQLVIYEPWEYDGRGRVVVALGDLDSAQNVSVAVPGTGARNDDYLDNHMQTGENLYAAAEAVGGSGQTAIVVYMGYRAPDVTDGMTMPVHAMAGARVIANDLAVLRASRLDDDPFLSVVPHSYGATTTSMALNQYGAEVDAVVFVGSPGAGTAESVADYPGVPAGQVFVMAETGDPVTYAPYTPVSGLGPDMTAESFGAQQLYAETDDVLLDAHSSYTSDSTSLTALGLVITQQSQLARRTAPRMNLLNPLDHLNPPQQATLHPSRRRVR